MQGRKSSLKYGLLKVVQQTSECRQNRGECSTFCLLLTWMQTEECDILCISFVTTAQSHGSTFCLLFPYLLACLLLGQETTCCRLFVQIQTYLGSERLDFWKEKKKKKQQKKNIHLKCGALKISFFRPLTLREMLFCVSNVTGENCNSCFSAENSLNYTTLHVKKYEKWTCLNIKYHSDLKSMSALPLVDGWCHHLHPCIGAGRTICWVRSWRSWHRAGDGVLSIILILILIQFYCFLKKYITSEKCYYIRLSWTWLDL